MQQLWFDVGVATGKQYVGLHRLCTSVLAVRRHSIVHNSTVLEIQVSYQPPCHYMSVRELFVFLKCNTH